MTDLILGLRFLVTHGSQFHRPVAWHELSEQWKHALQCVDWSCWIDGNLKEALYQVHGELLHVKHRATMRPMDTFHAVVETRRNPQDAQFIADLDEHGLYRNREYDVDVLHALEQQLDVGIDGYQWAYGLNEDCEHHMADQSCTLTFSVHQSDSDPDSSK